MNLLELNEQIKRVKVVRGGKRKIIKKTDNPNQKIVNNRVVKKTPAETIRRKKAQRIGKLKRKKKQNIANIKRKRSLKRRTF